MSVTVEDVARMALGIIADDNPHFSLDDNTKAARLLNLHYETTRQAELMKHAWAFAIFRAELTALEAADTPAGDAFEYAYAVPDDALRILPLTDSGEGTGISIPWKQEGSLLLSNYSGPRLVRYIGNLTDPADWNPLFTKAFTAALALEIALPLTNKSSLEDRAAKRYALAIDEARRVNAIQVGSAYSSVSWSSARGDWAGANDGWSRPA